MSRFYFLNSAYMPGSAMSTRMLAYIKGLSELGVETELVFFFPNEKRSRIEHVFPHIHVHYLWEHDNSRKTIIKGICYIKYLTRFLMHLKKGDCVYMYNMEDVFTFVQLKKGVKTFIERTEHPSVYPLGSRLYSPSIKQLIKAIKRGTGIIVISDALKQYFIQKGIPEEKICVINIIVDGERFANVESHHYIGKYVAYCGTASNSKDGVDELIRAFSIFHRSHRDYRLFIIGKVPSKEEEFDNLNLAIELGIRDNVVFTGQISPEKIPQILADASILALDRPDSIQARYGFPTKLGEYLLTGKPVVVTSVGDIPLFLEDKENSLIASPNDSLSFADKLAWAADNKERSYEIGQRGIKLAQKEFNYLTETRKLVSFINNESTSKS